MRCSRPAVPGTAHGRASVSGSRRYGWKIPPSAVAFETRDVREVGEVRDRPRLGAGGEERVGEVDDRGHVLERDAGGLDREVEALAGRRRRDDRDGRVGVAPEHHLEQVGLLVLRRHPGRRAGALDVDDDERQLDHDREAHRLGLERDARAGRGGQPERAAVARPDRRADRRDLVLGLERLDAEGLVPGQLVQDVARRRDRVRAVEQRAVGELARGEEARARSPRCP